MCPRKTNVCCHFSTLAERENNASYIDLQKGGDRIFRWWWLKLSHVSELGKVFGNIGENLYLVELKGAICAYKYVQNTRIKAEKVE